MVEDRKIRQELHVIQFQSKRRSRREIAFDKSMDDLLEAMRELRLIEKMTGRSGLPERVCLAFSDTIMCAMRLTGESAQAEVK